MDEMTNCFYDYVDGKDVYFRILGILNNGVNDGKFLPTDLFTTFVNDLMEKSSQRNDAEMFKMVLETVHEKIFKPYVWNSMHAEMHNHILNFVKYHNYDMIDFMYDIYSSHFSTMADGSYLNGVDSSSLRDTLIFVSHDHIIAFANYDSAMCEYILNKIPSYSRNELLRRIKNRDQLMPTSVTPQLALLLCV